MHPRLEETNRLFNNMLQSIPFQKGTNPGSYIGDWVTKQADGPALAITMTTFDLSIFRSWKKGSFSMEMKLQKSPFPVNLWS